MMEGIDQYRVNQVQPEVNKGVPKDILFEHNGAPNKEELYNTSYTATMNPNVTVPQRTSLRDQKQKQWDAEKAACSRNNKPYESTTASEYVEDNSCIVQPADKTHLFKGELTRTFESPHRKLRLRTNLMNPRPPLSMWKIIRALFNPLTKHTFLRESSRGRSKAPTESCGCVRTKSSKIRCFPEKKMDLTKFRVCVL